MARQLKPQKIGEYRHERRGVKVELFLDRNTHEFFFDFQKERYTKPSLASLKQFANELIEKQTALTWMPMITVEKLEPFCRNADTFIGFEIKRSWIAQKQNGHWLEGQWEDDDSADDVMRDREHWSHNFFIDRNVATFTLPFYGDSKYYLPYNDALWAGLETLLGHVRAMRKTLTELLTTPAGHMRVEQAATKRLTGGALALLVEKK